MVTVAENALRFVLSVSEDDKLLVITDEKKKAIGRAFEYGARRIGAKANSYIFLG